MNFTETIAFELPAHAAEVPDGRSGRNHIRSAAAIGDDVVQSRVLLDVLAHEVCAGVHELDRIKEDARLHYVITDGGGAPNVEPPLGSGFVATGWTFASIAIGNSVPNCSVRGA